MSTELLEVFVVIIAIALIVGEEMLVRCHRSHDTLGLGVLGAAQTLNQLEQHDRVLCHPNRWEGVGRFDVIFEVGSALVKNQNKGPCHISFIFVKFGGSFLMFLLPKVDVDVADLGNFTGVSRVLFFLRNRGNVDNQGGHCLDRFRYLVAVIRLNIISDLFEGAVEHGRVMGTCVIKDVVLKALCLANIFGGCPPPDHSSDCDAGDGRRDGSAGLGSLASGGDRVSCRWMSGRP